MTFPWCLLAVFFFVGIFLHLRERRRKQMLLKSLTEAAEKFGEGAFENPIAPRIAQESPELAQALTSATARIGKALGGLTSDLTQLRTALDNMTDAVVLLGPAGEVRQLNPAMEKLFALETVSSHGKNFADIVKNPELSDLISRGLHDCSVESADLTVAGQENRSYEGVFNPIMRETGLTGCVLVLHDVTRRRRLEDMRREFVANVSHELRTPLASIKGYAETLRRGGIEDEENRLDFVKTIEEHSDRLTLLVDDLLELAAVESGKIRLKPEPLALEAFIRDIVKNMQPLAQSKGIRLKNNIGEMRVSADKAVLRRIFQNLVANGIKYNREGGEVSISARADGRELEIRVQDTGPGIPAKDLPHLFERFYRVDKARSREMGGTGLGLSIVKHSVEAHGGRVWAESIEGEGATFFFTLPYAVK